MKHLLFLFVIFTNTFISKAQCTFTVSPDLPLLPSSASIATDIATVVNNFSDNYFPSAPSTAGLNNAITHYNNLNITINNGSISGNTITNFNDVSFLYTFYSHIKFNPSDNASIEMANNIVWLTAQQFCDGSLAVDAPVGYKFRSFGRAAVLLKDFLDPNVKSLLDYLLYKHFMEFNHLWAPLYDDNYQTNNGTINTDFIYNIADIMMVYVTWQDTPEEQYRYMTAFKRYLNRFASHTSGTSDGIKPDGSGFHHWTAFNGYMYAYSSMIKMLGFLGGSQFQIDQENYKIFRDAVYYLHIQSNDVGVSGILY